MTEHELLRGLFQESHIRWVQQSIGLGHPVPFEILSQPGDTWGIVLAMALALWLRGPRAAFTIAAAIAIAAPVWLGLTELFAVPRPSGESIRIYEELAAGSFPSGHVYHALVAWGVFAAMTRVSLWIAVGLALVTGVARVYLGAHYPVDVVAGLIAGAAFLGLALKLRGGVQKAVSPAVWKWTVVGLLVLLTVALLVGYDPGRLRRWELVGMIYGGGLAALAHLRGLLRGDRPPLRRLLAFGLPPLVLLALVSRIAGPERPWLGAAAMGTALVWVFFVLRLGAGAREEPRPREHHVGGSRSGG